jgi:hypothetical protein
MTGAEGDGEEGHYGRIGEQGEAIALRDGGEEQRGFHHGKAGTDADAGAASEGEVGEARKFFWSGQGRSASARDRSVRGRGRSADRGE